jgi:hypothetical protein
VALEDVADEVDGFDTVGEDQHARLGAPVILAQIRDVAVQVDPFERHILKPAFSLDRCKV